MDSGVYLGGGSQWGATDYIDEEQAYQSSTASIFASSFMNSLGGGGLATRAGAALDALSPAGNKITGAEANLKYGNAAPGYQLQWKPDEMVDEQSARDASMLKLSKMENDFIIAHGKDSVMNWGSAASGGLLGSLFDPVNLASTAIPTSWLGRASTISSAIEQTAEGASRMAGIAKTLQASWLAQAAIRTGTAGVNNALIVAAMQPLEYAGDQQMHEDYTFASAANQILMGGAAGVVLHGVLGEIPSLLSLQARKALLKAEAAKMTATTGLDPQAAVDIANTSPQKIANDLGLDINNPDHAQAINTEAVNRTQAIIEKKVNGSYDLNTNPEGSPVHESSPDLDRASQEGDMSKAADLLEQETQKLAAGTDFFPEDREALAGHDQNAAAIQKGLDNYAICISSI